MDACEDSSPTFSDYNKTIFPLDDGNPDYCQYSPIVAPLENSTCPISSFDLEGNPVECPSDGPWYYEPYEMDSTVVTEFDLVCDDQYKVKSHSTLN